MEAAHGFNIIWIDADRRYEAYCSCGLWWVNEIITHRGYYMAAFQDHLKEAQDIALESAQDDVSRAERLVSNLDRHNRLWRDLSVAIDGAKRNAALGSLSPSRIVHIAYLWAELNADRQDS